LIELKKNSKRIIIQTSEFKRDGRNLEFDLSGKFLEKIDGKNIYGTDGNVPRKQILDFYFINNNEKIEVIKSYYSDLFEPVITCLNGNNDTYCYTTAYLTEKEEVILTMQNSDGSGGYMVIFLFNKNGQIKDRIIGYQF